MATVRKLSVSVSDDLAAMMSNAVAGGDYNSTSEVVREALRDWKLKQARTVILKEKIQSGFDDLEAGRFTEYGGAGELFDDIMKN